MKSLIRKGMFGLVLAIVFFVAQTGRVLAASGSSPVVISVLIRNNHFETAVVNVPRGVPILFRVTNQDNGMEEFESYDMAFEVLVHPHQTIEVPVSGLGAGVYEYFGDFHPRTAHGRIIVK